MLTPPNTPPIDLPAAYDDGAPHLRARAASVIGREHAMRNGNSQDAFTLLELPQGVVGVVCDGCGSGARSEVGATLGAQYVAARAADALAQGVELAQIPARVHAALLDYLRQMVWLMRPSDGHAFIHDHLLFTVLGLVATEGGAVLFAAGDGVVCLDQQVMQRDENNMPNYPAYQLLNTSALGDAAPSIRGRTFDMHAVPQWSRLAIGTDGVELDVLGEVWGHTHVRGLQRKFNFWSTEQKRFRDDATMIVVEKL
jgi:hypothetical protein